MKVVYKKTVIEQLLELKEKAYQENKTIDYVAITSEEAKELNRELHKLGVVHAFNHYEQLAGTYVHGLRLLIDNGGEEE